MRIPAILPSGETEAEAAPWIGLSPRGALTVTVG